MYDPIKPIIERAIKKRVIVSIKIQEGWETATPSTSVPCYATFSSSSSNSERTLFKFYRISARNSVEIFDIKVFGDSIKSRKYLVMYLSILIDNIIKEAMGNGKTKITIGTKLVDVWYSFLKHGFKSISTEDENFHKGVLKIEGKDG